MKYRKYNSFIQHFNKLHEKMKRKKSEKQKRKKKTKTNI